MYRNLTIRLTEEAVRWLRREAADMDTSMSRFVQEVVEHQMRRGKRQPHAFQNWTAEQRWPAAKYGADAWMSREEIHDRDRDRHEHGD